MENKVNPDLQATFKRLELEQQLDEGQGLCGYAKKDPSLILGRLCELQDRLFCENWNKPELVEKCPILKKYQLTPEKF